MVTLFLSPSCTSCRKARAWLTNHEVAFDEHNIITSPLTHDELMKILSYTENGTEDIISTRSKVFQEMNVDLDDLSLNELVKFIRENPSILKRPIILNEKNLVVGYDDDEITSFVPSELRNLVSKTCNETCQNYEICGACRKEA